MLPRVLAHVVRDTGEPETIAAGGERCGRRQRHDALVLGDADALARREVVELLVDAAAADGTLSPLEMKTIKRIAAALGIER